MKNPLLRLVLVASVFLGASVASLRADDWKTNDGKVYQDVKVVQVEPDAVTILHHDGGGRIPLANLPPDLQKRFSYDPAKAKSAADARARDDAQNAKALQAEMNQASDMRQAGPDPDDAPATDSASAPTGDVTGGMTDSHDGTHYSMSDLSSAMGTLKLNPAGPTHYSIDDLAESAAAMRRDLADPTYHTMAHTAYAMRLLGPDPNDPNHHTIGELSDLRVDPLQP